MTLEIVYAQTTDEVVTRLHANLPILLKLLRTAENLTQEQVSKLACISRSHYCRIEKGQVVPDLTTICLLMNFYRVSLDCLTAESTAGCMELASRCRSQNEIS